MTDADADADEDEDVYIEGLELGVKGFGAWGLSLGFCIRCRLGNC